MIYELNHHHHRRRHHHLLLLLLLLRLPILLLLIQWSNYRKISKGAHTIEVPKVGKRGPKCQRGGVWGLLRTIGDSRNVELGRGKKLW